MKVWASSQTLWRSVFSKWAISAGAGKRAGERERVRVRVGARADNLGRNLVLGIAFQVTIALGVMGALLMSCAEENEEPQENLQLWGVAEKGPYVAGAKLTVVGTTKSGENPDDTSVEASVGSDNGYFMVSIPRAAGAEAAFVYLEAEGKFFQEISAKESVGEYILKAVAAIPDRQKKMGGDVQMNINVVTHLTHLRAKKLITSGGMNAKDAIAAAEAELREGLSMVVNHPLGDDVGSGQFMSLSGGDTPDNAYLLGLSCLISKTGRNEHSVFMLLDDIAQDLEDDGIISDGAWLNQLVYELPYMDPLVCSDNLEGYLSIFVTDLIMPNISTVLDTDGDGILNSEDDDMDGDGIPNEEDCAPGNVLLGYLLEDGITCVAIESNDWDGDGVPNEEDCAPRDPLGVVLLESGDCVADSDDWDGDGMPNGEDCAPKDSGLQFLLVDGETCVADSDDWDGDGVPNGEDCAPLDLEFQLYIEELDACLPDVDDWDGDGVPNGEDCAPLEPLLQLLLDDGVTCVAAYSGDWDGDRVSNEDDCAPMDPRINPIAGEIVDGIDNNCDGTVDEGWCGKGEPLTQVLALGESTMSLLWCTEPGPLEMEICLHDGCQYVYTQELNHDDATAACAAHEGYSLPTLQNYKDLLGYCDGDVEAAEEGLCTSCMQHEACAELFGYTNSEGGAPVMFWSSTIMDTGEIFAVDIRTGRVYLKSPGILARVRCVSNPT